MIEAQVTSSTIQSEHISGGRSVPVGQCVCRHGRDAHNHYRGGTECALCPAGACGRYLADIAGGGMFSRLRRIRFR